MANQTNLVIWADAAYFWMAMAMIVVESRKRKKRGRHIITYAPIAERDRIRTEYLNNKIWKDDITCVNMLRIGRGAFY